MIELICFLQMVGWMIGWSIAIQHDLPAKFGGGVVFVMLFVLWPILIGKVLARIGAK